MSIKQGDERDCRRRWRSSVQEGTEEVPVIYKGREEAFIRGTFEREVYSAQSTAKALGSPSYT